MIGFNFFFPTLVQGMGYKDTYKILLLTVPPYALAFIASLCKYAICLFDLRS
jgi:hypothetical protein